MKAVRGREGNRTHAGRNRPAIRAAAAATAAAALALCCAPRAAANGFRNPPESATGLGTVGARYALVDDVSAMAFNPAHLAGLKSPTALASVGLVHSGAEAAAAFGSASTEGGWYTLPALFAAEPLSRDGLVAGLGVTAPFGQSTEWPETGVFRYAAPYFAELRVINANPTLACRLSKTLSAGLGADVFCSDLDLRMIYPWSGTPGLNPQADGRALFDASGVGVGANAGLLWRPAARHTVALSYRSSVKVDYSGDFRIDNVPAMPPGSPVTPASDFDTDMEFPAVAGLGYALQCGAKLRVGADVEWIRFSTVDDLPLDIHNNNVLLPPGASPMRQDWDDAWTAGAGAVYGLSREVALRAGYIFMQSPIPDRTFSPTLPDGDQHVITAGVTCRAAGGALALACGLGINEDRTIRDNLNPAFNGTYKIEDSKFVSASYALSF